MSPLKGHQLEAQDVRIFPPFERRKYGLCELRESLILRVEQGQRETKDNGGFLEQVQVEKELERIWRQSWVDWILLPFI